MRSFISIDALSYWKLNFQSFKLLTVLIIKMLAQLEKHHNQCFCIWKIQGYYVKLIIAYNIS